MKMEEMEARMIALEKKVSLMDDLNQVKRLQYAYSYYVMRMMKDEIVDCFAEHPETGLYWLEGAYLGKDAVKRYFGVGTDKPDPEPEFFHQVMPIAGVVDVNPNGERAKARWYTSGTHSLPADGGKFNKSFVAGIYEIENIKQNGVWKFLKINWLIPYTISLPDESWKWPETIGERFANPSGFYVPPESDIPFDPADPRFMTGYVLPFHYKHPVTGKATSENAKNKKIISANKSQKKMQK